jgi:hypothetical protein
MLALRLLLLLVALGCCGVAVAADVLAVKGVDLSAVAAAGSDSPAAKQPSSSAPAVSLVGEGSEVEGSLAQSSEDHLRKHCWYDGEEMQMTPHQGDPRKYFCGSHLMWYRSNSRRRRYVRRCGKWYRNRRSNMYYKAGSWLPEAVRPHPTNPTLVRRACAWVRRKRTPAVSRFFRNPKTGIWFRNKRSLEYYIAGSWGHFEAKKRHPTNPNLRLRAGRWVKARGLRGQGRWRKRCGKWWLRGPGAGPKSFTVYRGGKWRMLSRYTALRNNPFYRWKESKCKFVRLRGTDKAKLYVIKGRKVFRGKSALKGGGFWFRSKDSLWYYKNMVWHLASRHLASPRWTRDARTGVWRRLTRVERPQIASYVKVGKLWFRDSAKRQYWFYGRWKNVKGRAAKPRVVLKDAEDIGLPKPTNIANKVNRATNKEFGRFLNWYLAKRVERVPDPVDWSQSVVRTRALPSAVKPKPLPVSPVKVVPKKDKYSPELGIMSAASKYNVEPAAGRRLDLMLKRLQRPASTEDDEQEYGAPEPVWPDMPINPDLANPPVSDSLRWGRLARRPRYASRMMRR